MCIGGPYRKVRDGLLNLLSDMFQGVRRQLARGHGGRSLCDAQAGALGRKGGAVGWLRRCRVAEYTRGRRVPPSAMDTVS